MFRYLRLKKHPHKVEPSPGSLTARWLSEDASVPATLKQLNELPEGAKKRIYRALIPPNLPRKFDIDPISWRGRSDYQLTLKAEPLTGEINISIGKMSGLPEEFFCLQLLDNAFNGIDLNFLLISDPWSSRFDTDRHADGSPTLFGKARRNLVAEEQAKQAGLAPGQVRKGLAFSSIVLQQVEAFLATCGHNAYYLEPMTYAAAWVFERHGLAYVRGHKLMDDIHKEFQCGGRLCQALDGRTPFRQPDQWSTVRGRAWAIHDGVLDAIDAKWDKLRMVKQVGRHAGVESFPNSFY
ncbi:MAG: hypothetical protein GY850_26995 [bacterium]|nr:hypothetical protein [bacterium]